MKTFDSVCKEIIDLHEKKNKDYGNSFESSMDDFGITAPLIRLGDKYSRLKSICKSGNIEVKDESVRDTLIDLAAYSIMTIEYLDNHDNKRNKQPL